MKISRAIFMSGLILLQLSAAPVFADEAADRWAALPEAQKQELRENYKKFQAMSPDDRKRVVENYKKFKALPPAKQDELRTRFRRFKSLPPEEQKARIRRLEERRNQRRRRTTHK